MDDAMALPAGKPKDAPLAESAMPASRYVAAHALWLLHACAASADDEDEETLLLPKTMEREVR